MRLNDLAWHNTGVPPTLDIHVDNGTPGGDVIAMRISLNGSGQPTITDSNSSSIEEVVRRMMGELPTPAGEISGDLGQAQGVQGEAMLVVEEDSASDSVEQSYQQVMLSPHEWPSADLLACSLQRPHAADLLCVWRCAGLSRLHLALAPSFIPTEYVLWEG